MLKGSKVVWKCVCGHNWSWGARQKSTVSKSRIRVVHWLPHAPTHTLYCSNPLTMSQALISFQTRVCLGTCESAAVFLSYSSTSTCSEIWGEWKKWIISVEWMECFFCSFFPPEKSVHQLLLQLSKQRGSEFPKTRQLFLRAWRLDGKTLCGLGHHTHIRAHANTHLPVYLDMNNHIFWLNSVSNYKCLAPCCLPPWGSDSCSSLWLIYLRNSGAEIKRI